jgi:uncharacterized membrane protein required for colicin V production
MTGRALFIVAAGTILVLIFLALVVVPGVQRGGWGEVLGIIAIVLAVLLAERWLRSLGR